MKIKIKHVDGVTDVVAKVHFGKSEINLEYRFEGMTYGRTVGLAEAVKIGIVKCDHAITTPVMGYENSQTGEICTICNKEL